MPPRFCKLDGEVGANLVRQAVAELKKNKVIALPTDTIYGLACLAQSVAGVRSIYDIKGRDFGKPLAICVASISDVFRYSKVTIAKAALEELFPGPTTLVFERSLCLNSELNPSSSLVGIRIPEHDFVRALCAECGGPLALTSANLSGAKSPLAITDFEDIWPRLAVVYDAGTLSSDEKQRAGSTVVDLSVAGKYRVIRDGR
eukprot:Sdes_comp19213_c0_seq3m10101